MSAPLNDVLAVLRAARDSVPGEQLLAYCAAMADVGELIYALRECIEAEQPMAQMHATERARAALARAAGEAA